MSHTQVRANEATTNHEENNYGLFSLFYTMVGIAIPVSYTHLTLPTTPYV